MVIEKSVDVPVQMPVMANDYEAGSSKSMLEIYLRGNHISLYS
jgi:hypothetical protein